MTIPWRRLQWFIGLCCLLVPSMGLAQPEKVIFSAPGGFYDESFTEEEKGRIVTKEVSTKYDEGTTADPVTDRKSVV